ncbi:MAG: hypothetical protein JWN11_379 [Hyphomicrobiales bacterium]|nr:hypothetical protein [Hyphomicrobiales bacterium]
MLRRLPALGAAALFVVAATTGSFAQDLQDLTIRFTWKYKGEYAPLFVALDKGYFSTAGLKVTLAEGSSTQSVLSVVATGKEAMGYGAADAVAAAVDKDLPLKVIAVYQTKSPSVLVSFPDKPVNKPSDLEGKSVATAQSGSFARLLSVFVKANNLDISKVQLAMMDASVGDTQFLSHKVDVTSAFTNNEVPLMEKVAGVTLVKMPISDFGLPILGSSLFTSDAFIAAHPDTVSHVLAAIAHGYQDAIANPQQATDIMMKYLPQGQDPDVLLQQVKATMQATNVTDGKTIGWQADRNWTDMLSILADTKQISKVLPLDKYFSNALFK